MTKETEILDIAIERLQDIRDSYTDYSRPCRKAAQDCIDAIAVLADERSGMNDDPRDYGEYTDRLADARDHIDELQRMAAHATVRQGLLEMVKRGELGHMLTPRVGKFATDITEAWEESIK